MSQKQLFGFGYGYCCEHLANRLITGNDSTHKPAAFQSSMDMRCIAGTTRQHDKKEHMKAHDIRAYFFDYNAPLDAPKLFLKDITHLLISTPPRDEGDPAFLNHAEDIIDLPSLEWVGYLSSTSVYGDRGGDWVDENSSVTKTSKRGERRITSENQWLSLYHDYDIPVHIFRLAGIYGPGRSAIDSVRAGHARRIDKPGHAFSRTHIDDIVNVLLASMEKPNPGSIYNICDDHAAPSHEVIAYACELLGLPVPELIPFDGANMAPMALSFYNDNKRVRNDKIKNELGVTLDLPNYKKGLEACLAAETPPETLESVQS